MALRKYTPLGGAHSIVVKPLGFSSQVHENAQPVDPGTSQSATTDVDVDLREVYFLIMHFLSAGPCQRTYGQLWNELLEHQLLPRRYHAWYSRSGVRSGDEVDDGFSFPLSYSKLAERYPHVEKNHLVKLLKQLLLNTASPSPGLFGANSPNAANVPTLLGTGSFSLLSNEKDSEKVQVNHPPTHMRWPHMHADQVRGLSLREIGGGFARHHRAPSVRAACYTIAKPSTMVQKMQNIKRLRGHRNAVYCAIFDRSGRYVVTGSDDRLVKIWSMETAFCLASCRGHEGDITDLAVSSNNALVASASNDCIIRVWRMPDGLPISVLRGHTGAVTALAFSPRPGSIYQLLSSSDDGTCRIWDSRNSSCNPRIYTPRPSDSAAGKNGAPSASSVPQTYQIFCCAFNANGTVFVTGSSDHLARVWNACRASTEDTDQPNHELDVLSGHENDVNYVQFSGCAISSRFSLSESSKEEKIPKFRNSWFSHDNIVTCSRDGSAIIWIPRSRRSHGKAGRWVRSYHLKVPPPPMPPQPPRGGPRQRILPTPRGVNMIVWSLDNRFVLAAIMDCRICVWNATDGSLVHSLTGHTQSTYALDVHPFNPRIAMSAGYDGKTIVWDIWEGTPIRIYEISRFKLVDGKFSADGTSIILSDDVGQLYILSTGQGESQKDAKYDQFFLGDYRPLIQDTYGNVLDQETQLVPYRRNMQDLLCDSGMNPYTEPYQSMYQKRRLGALGMEWKPSSIKLAVGPDFSLDPDYQMLPLVDLDVLVEPLPEFIDTMEWEPENIIVQSGETDSEYNFTEESSGGDEGSLNSSSSGDQDCSADDSEVEGRDGFRRSKRKKQKAEEIMTSSGRRVKRRNLDECDGTTFRSNRSRKSKIGRKASKKSSKSKALRPRRAAARNALTLFSKITGVTTDADDDDDAGSERYLSESESNLQDSNMESDESDGSLQNEKHRNFKGKDIFLEESEDYDTSPELTESHINGGNRRRLVLKLPARNSSKIVVAESMMHKSGKQFNVVGSSSKSRHGGAEVNGLDSMHPDPEYSSGEMEGRGQKYDSYVDLTESYRNGDIRWGGARARTSKRQRLGEASSSAACTISTNGDNQERLNIPNGFLEENKDHGSTSPVLERLDEKTEMAPLDGPTVGIDVTEVVVEHVINGELKSADGCTYSSEGLAHMANWNGKPPDANESNPPISTNLRMRSTNVLRDSIEDQGRDGCDLLLVSPEDKEQKQIYEVPGLLYNGINTADILKQEPGSQAEETAIPSVDNSMGSQSRPKNMFNVVYRRSKSSRDRISSNDDGGKIEANSNASTHGPLTNGDTHEEGTSGGAHQENSVFLMAPSCGTQTLNRSLRLGRGSESHTSKSPKNRSVGKGELPSEEWASSSTMKVGLRSARNRKANYVRDASPAERQKSQQSGKRVPWLMLSAHEEGSRYIPQQGDEVAYLRQGHQEYIEYSGSREAGPWKAIKGGDIRAVEFCMVENLEYSTLAGSGDSCCKMVLVFVDPASSVFKKSFKLTLPEVTSFPDFLVERTRFDSAIKRNWSGRDKCKVWWKNEGEDDGSWWDGRVLSVKPKSSEFLDSPWERYTIQYRGDPKETHLHSPWELFDANTQWEQPQINEESRNKLMSALAKLDQSGRKAKDPYGIEKLAQVSQKTIFTNRFPVPLSLEVIESRLENCYYRSLDAVKHDIQVMLSNAESYFGKNAELSVKMKRLSDWFSKTLSSL